MSEPLFLQEFCEIYRKTFLDRSPLVVASAIGRNYIKITIKIDGKNPNWLKKITAVMMQVI